MIPSCQEDQYGCLDILNVKIRPLVQILKTKQDVARSLVPILATRELVAPLANDHTILGKSIWSFEHKIRLLFQIILTAQDVARSLVPILATKEALAPLANNPFISGRSIWWFQHLKH